MSTQRTGSMELSTTIATESSPLSLAASVPPELFKNILVYVGDEDRLGYHSGFGPSSSLDAGARREEIKHLSSCALTCVYWAHLTRERMFRFLVLRSLEDMSRLLFLLRAPQAPRITPICDAIQYLSAYYTLSDHPWFHNLARLKSCYGVAHLKRVDLHISGPVTPAFAAASTRRSVLHPLFFATPRVLPVIFPKGCDFHLFIESIHLPHPTMLFNLLQDCLSLHPQYVDCINLTWDIDPVLHATPSAVGLKYSCRMEPRGGYMVSRCTDDVLVAAMVKSIPHHEFSQRRQGPHLSPLDTTCLFDVMRTTRKRWSGSSTELERTEDFSIFSDPDFDSIQKDIAVRLPPGTEFCFEWRVDRFMFRCIALRLPHAAATGGDVCNIAYIIIDLRNFDDHNELEECIKTVNIDWGVLPLAIRRLPHLRQITIQDGNSLWSSDSHRILAAFVAHLGGTWTSLGNILALYYGTRSWKGDGFEYDWVHVQLDTLMDKIKQRRAEIESESDAGKAASRKLESSVVEESESAYND